MYDVLKKLQLMSNFIVCIGTSKQKNYLKTNSFTRKLAYDLGLSNILKLVKKMKDTLKVTQQKGKMLEFYFTLFIKQEKYTKNES